MRIVDAFSDMIENVANRLLPISEVEELKHDLELDLRDARLGCFTDNELIIADCERRISQIEKELARRQGAR